MSFEHHINVTIFFLKFVALVLSLKVPSGARPARGDRSSVRKKEEEEEERV